jgi:hypothetical protein
MKRIIVSVAVTFIIGISAVRANNVPAVDNKVTESFRKEFPGASLVQWEEKNQYFAASFVLNDVHVMAFFDHDGELLGSINAVFFDQLPMAVRNSIGKHFSDAVILETYEITNPENTRYKLVLEIHGKKYTTFLFYDGTFGKIQRVK